MNDLEHYFYHNNGRLIHKWKHYFDVYERYFSRYRQQPVVILEIGVFHGGSLQLWKHYFGPQAKIYGIDINPRCKELEEENIQIFIGSQADPQFLASVKAQIPDIDILLDDGGHSMEQQIVSFECLFDKVKPDGVYVCEDTMSSYWLEYGGGYRRKGTFIEYAKNFVDSLHAWHSTQADFKPDALTRSVASVAFYDGIVVLEKKPIAPPSTEMTGTPSFPDPPEPPRGWIERRVYAFLLNLNKVLRRLRWRSVYWK